MSMFYELRKLYGQLFRYPVSRLKGDVDYDAYWHDKRQGNVGALTSWQQDRAELALSCIGRDKAVSIVDVGSGDGSILRYMKERSKIGRAVAVDMSDVVLDKAKEFGFETVKADINKEEGRSRIPQADYILLFEILEHIPDPETFLKLMYEKAGKGVLFSFPNTGYFVHRLRLLFGKFPLQWRLHPGEHLRFWTLADLRWWLTAQGYEDYEIETYKGVPLLRDLLPSLFAAGSFVFLKK